MIPITPEQANVLLQFILPTVKNEHRITRSVIEAIPLTNTDYRPDPKSKTAMELAWHIVASENRFYCAVVAGEFDFSPIPRPEHVQTPAQIGNWYGDSFARNFDHLTKLPGEHLAKNLDFRGVFQMPAVAFLGFSLNHVIHHRGQLCTYLRPMGGKVPAIYGESYDSAVQKAAQT